MEAEGLKGTPLRLLVTIVTKKAFCKKLFGASEAKKLVLVLATSASVIGASKEAQVTQEVALDRVSCLYYPVHFWKDKGATIWALINSVSEVNTMTPAYAKKLSLRAQKTDVGAQKIDGSSLDTFGMVFAGFQMINQLGRAQFFQETFLFADTTMEVVLKMLFLTLSNSDI